MNPTRPDNGRGLSHDLYQLAMPNQEIEQQQLSLSSLLARGSVQTPVRQLPVQEDTLTTPVIPPFSQNGPDVWSLEQVLLTGPVCPRSTAPSHGGSSASPQNPMTHAQQGSDCKESGESVDISEEIAPPKRSGGSKSYETSGETLEHEAQVHEALSRLEEPSDTQGEEYEAARKAYKLQRQKDRQLKRQEQVIDRVKEWQQLQLVKEKYRPSPQQKARADYIERVVSDIPAHFGSRFHLDDVSALQQEEGAFGEGDSQHS